MGFTTGTAASDGAKLGVGDTLLVALVVLVGVGGACVGVAGAVVLWDLLEYPVVVAASPMRFRPRGWSALISTWRLP